MHKKVKSEQHFAVTGAKTVALFRASLKLVREEGVPIQLSNKKGGGFPMFIIADIVWYVRMQTDLPLVDLKGEMLLESCKEEGAT